MDKTDLKRYIASWKAEQSFEKNLLSASDIRGFLKKNSKEINKLFRKGLILDMVLKSIIGASFIVLFFLFSGSAGVLVMISALLAGNIAAILYQGRMFRKIPQADYASDNLRQVLESKISFYRRNYLKSLYVGALSNAFLIISGMLYYFYFRYGEVRPFGAVDYVVFCTVIMLGFLFGAFVQIKQHNFQIRQLEVCLEEIDENTIHQGILDKQRKRRMQLFLMYFLAIICGLLILAFFLARVT